MKQVHLKMTNQKNHRKILVTNALTYANGDLHLGHLVGYIQSDIWVRFQKMCGNNCTFICGSDSHGTPIMIKAQQEKLQPEAMVKEIEEKQLCDCKKFLIDFDNFRGTNTQENRQLCEDIYKKLCENGDIVKREIEQLYDSEKEMFLPDRYVKGECPCCGAKDQYGDNCEVCGSTYGSGEIKNPISILSGKTPIHKKSEHYFFKLQNYTDKLLHWIDDGHLQEEVANKLREWFKEGLQEWDISRDAPYFGFQIPNVKDKFFYVWLDAPMGYISIFKYLCDQKTNLDFDEYWNETSTAELYHFLGKDIMYFHALFWPAILMGAKLRTPTINFIHGFLTINGEKMSKSRGTFILAKDYMEYLHPEYLRYYVAAKSANNFEDIDLNLEDFKSRVNSDLVGKVVNIASRCAGFIEKKFDKKLSTELHDTSIFKEFADKGNLIANLYEQREFSKAMREIMTLADTANQYIAENAPWKLVKEKETLKQAHQNLYHRSQPLSPIDDLSQTCSSRIGKKE